MSKLDELKELAEKMRQTAYEAGRYYKTGALVNEADDATRDFVLALKAVVEDAERLDWLDGAIFMHRWNGVIGPGSEVTWTIAGDWRHTAARMTGEDLRSAIDAARKP